MTYWLVTALPLKDRLADLEEQLRAEAFVDLRPFGESLTLGLTGARMQPDGMVTWEEEDYCVPPLAQERAAVLDKYFTGIEVEAVDRGDGWQKISKLPPLFPSLSES